MDLVGRRVTLGSEAGNRCVEEGVWVLRHQGRGVTLPLERLTIRLRRSGHICDGGVPTA